MREGWTTATLGEIADFPTRKHNYDEGDLPYLSFKGLQADGVLALTNEKKPGVRTEPGDTVITAQGHVAGWVGKKVSPVIDRDLIAASTLLVLRPRTVIPGFLNAWVRSPMAQVAIAGSHIERTSAHKPTLKSLMLPVPPLVVQRRIVDLIDHIDELRGVAETAAENASAAYEALLQSEVGNIEQPDRMPVAEVVTTARAGGTPSRKRPDNFGGSIPWLKSGEVDNPAIRDTEESITDEGLSSSSAWMVPSQAVVVAMYGATAGEVGFTEIDLTTNQAVLALRADESKICGRYLYHALRSVKRHLKDSATGAAQANLSKSRVLEQRIAVPPIERQKAVAAALDALLVTRSAYLTGAERQAALRANVTTEVLSGDHEIPESYDRLLEEGAA